jgi:hypothetical protein
MSLMWGKGWHIFKHKDIDFADDEIPSEDHDQANKLLSAYF